MSEFNISRAKAAIRTLPQDALFDSLNLAFSPASDLAVTQSADRTSFDIVIDRLGINLITGMKGSGKSYLAKRLLLKLIDNGVLSIVFDVNAEYLNLRNADAHTPSRYADRMITFTPYLAHESDAERVLMIPVHEILYDDFAAFVNVPRESAMYLYLIQFWSQNRDIAFTLDDLERFIKTIDNEFARAVVLWTRRSRASFRALRPEFSHRVHQSDAEARRSDHIQPL